MSTTSALESTLLKLFAEARDHKLSATTLKNKLATTTKKSGTAHEAEQVDAAITALIDGGKVAVTGGGKTGHHPRAKGSYRLTGAGKDHVKPGKPDHSDELIGNQEAYILFQFLRIKDGASSMTRSDLNGKLGTKAAREQFELDPKVNKDVLDYHLHQLVNNGSLEEARKGVSLVYTLTDAGLKTLGSGKQYDHPSINFTLNGPALNKLLEAARQSSGTQHADATKPAEHTPEPVTHAPPKSAEIEPKQIHDFIAHLKADKYAGKDLIPIHEVRALVAQHHGDHAASHPVFDRLLKTMRSEDELEIIAIADNRDATQEQLDSSIPNKNETLFYIIVN